MKNMNERIEKSNMIKVRGTCDCGKRVSRYYELSILKGLIGLSDNYSLKMECSCDKNHPGGNVKKETTNLKELLREDKIIKILENV